MLVSLRGTGFDATVVDDHLWGFHLLQNRPGGRQIIYVQILRLRYEERRVQNQHRSVDAVLVQNQLVGLAESRYDPFLWGVDEWTDGL